MHKCRVQKCIAVIALGLASGGRYKHEFRYSSEETYLLHIWVHPKNWPRSMKVEKLENLGRKFGLTGCKWSSLNAAGTETLVSNPFLELGEFPFPIISLLG